MPLGLRERVLLRQIVRKKRGRCATGVVSTLVRSTFRSWPVKHADFHIGLEFIAGAGFRWRCTDVGTRTILAIQLDRRNPDWYQGPPYIAKEVVFDEQEMGRCHLTFEEAVSAAALNNETSGHPGYSVEAMERMMKALHAHHYPHDGVLRFDRRRGDGEILHPYAGRRDGSTWMVNVYLPFQGAFDIMAESDFIALPRVTAQDIRSRADRARRSAAAHRLQQLADSDPDANVSPRRRGRPR
jgi:hypothetical protein